MSGIKLERVTTVSPNSVTATNRSLGTTEAMSRASILAAALSGRGCGARPGCAGD